LTDEQRSYLRVAVALPVRETFFYAIPDNLLPKAEIGRRVLVPFRNRKVIGYILEKRHGEQEESLKAILEVLDEEPLFPEGLVPFFQWMSEYYLYPIGRFIQSALPGGLNARPFKTGQITEKGLKALKGLSAHSKERSLLLWAKKNPGKRLPSPLELAYTLQKKGWLIIESRTGKRGVGPLIRKFVKAKKGVDLQSILQESGSSIQAKNESAFLEALFNADAISLKELSARFSNGTYLVNKWIRKGVLEKYGAPVVRNLAGEVAFPSPVPHQLYDQQKAVFGEIQHRLNKKSFSTFLLHGITGSGKTEVYYRAIEEAIRQDRQALLLVPEIALAVYMEGIFRSRLGNRVAIYHSGLSAGERYDQWVRIVRGEVDLVIGARSALFSPLPNLGLIIVDEEHDFSYKQEEGPRYQARDAAVVRGRLEKALVILGSGTPSVQSFHHAATGRYQLLSMPERIERRPLPDVQIVDMKAMSQDASSNGIISPILRTALEESLTDGKQVILFLNRRGFNRVYLCRSCGQAIRCTNCDLALIYHLRENRLACHYCGFHSQPENRCSRCGHEGMKAYGFGTERLEQELREAFPDKRIARMDRDSTRRKGQSFLILKRFSEQEIDIMVGTQMITKGYDFPEVTLVGVIAADLSLSFPDFRAGERTFQLLSQVAGRAGRGEQRGKVVVQTFNPEHYAIVTARDHDYASFFQRERDLREQLGYPPFSYLACLRLQGNNSEITANMTQRVGRGARAVLKRWPKRGREIQVLGPAEAPLTKLKGKYRWQILIKCKRAELLHYFLREIDALARKVLRGSGVSLIVDVDPYQML
jgi:primosomal protein N' (replication factor Y)